MKRWAIVALALVAVAYMANEARVTGVALANANGFGSDFHGTIWAPDRAVLHGVSPYPVGAKAFAAGEPAVYLPPIFVATVPLGWLSLHAATLVWFAVLVAAALGTVAVLGVRDPVCYALAVLSLPVAQALAIGNASILVAFGAAVAWRFRKHPVIGPVAVAATVAVKFWLWPLLVWMLIVRPRLGLRASVVLAALVLGAWAVIGFDGLRGYPALMGMESRTFSGSGVLFVAALIQIVHARLAATAVAFVLALGLLGVAWLRRADELDVFTLALFAALVAAPVGWSHYLILMGLPIMVAWPRLSFAWAWFPALCLVMAVVVSSVQWIVAGCLFAAVAAMLVVARGRSQALRESGAPRGLIQTP